VLVVVAACAAAPVVAARSDPPRLRDYDAADPVFPLIDFSDVREIPPEDIMHPPPIEDGTKCTNPAPVADVDDFERGWLGCVLTQLGEGALPAESIRVLVLPSFNGPVMARVTTVGATHQLVVASKTSHRKRALVDAEWQRLQRAITAARLDTLATALDEDMAHADGTLFVIETLRHGVHRIVHRSTPGAGGTYLALVDLVFTF
jgi:hypothetical protein